MEMGKKVFFSRFYVHEKLSHLLSGNVITEDPVSVKMEAPVKETLVKRLILLPNSLNK